MQNGKFRLTSNTNEWNAQSRNEAPMGNSLVSLTQSIALFFKPLLFPNWSEPLFKYFMKLDIIFKNAHFRKQETVAVRSLRLWNCEMFCQVWPIIFPTRLTLVTNIDANVLVRALVNSTPITHDPSILNALVFKFFQSPIWITVHAIFLNVKHSFL